MLLRILRLPVVLFLLLVVAGAVAQARVPLSIGIPSFRLGLAIGAAVFLAGAAFAGSAIVTMRRHRTTIEPEQRPDALVRSGVFRVTRNPMYLTLVLLAAAVAVMLDSGWLLVSAALLALALDRIVIRWEERTLEEAFGDAYREYKRHVRRWI